MCNSYTTMGAISSSCLYSVYFPLSESTGLSFDQLNSSTGYTYLFIGIGALFFQPLALAVGKRPVYLFTSLVSIPLTIWTIHTRGISQWLPNRLLLGFFGAPLFTLGEVSICDVYFYHQRAWPMGGYVALLYGGACLGPLMGGYVYQSKGWEAVIVSRDRMLRSKGTDNTVRHCRPARFQLSLLVVLLGRDQL